MRYLLKIVKPDSPKDWQAYHEIRKKVLWDERGLQSYMYNHPDDLNTDNFPLLFSLDNTPVGVIRIDFKENGSAYFRKVAIESTEQRKGFGTKLMKAAELFALSYGSVKVYANVAFNAIPFYKKMGYEFLNEEQKISDNPKMFKFLGDT